MFYSLPFSFKILKAIIVFLHITDLVLYNISSTTISSHVDFKSANVLYLPYSLFYNNQLNFHVVLFLPYNCFSFKNLISACTEQ